MWTASGLFMILTYHKVRIKKKRERKEEKLLQTVINFFTKTLNLPNSIKSFDNNLHARLLYPAKAELRKL